MTFVTIMLAGGLIGAVVFYFMLYFKATSEKTPLPRASRDPSMDDADVVIVGGGILGSAFATVLARNGRRVAVIEKNMGEVESIAGEALMPGGVRALNKLGLGEVIREIKGATPLKKLAQSHEKESVWEFTLPRPSLGFHHEKFVTALRERAALEKNVTFVEGIVTDVIEDENGIVNGVKYRTENGDNLVREFHAAVTVVADGRFSKFRKQFMTKSPVSSYVAVGTLLDGDSSMEDANQLHYYSFDDLSCYMVVYDISDTDRRAMLFAADGTSKNMKEFIADVIAPRLPERLQAPLRDGLVKNGIRTCRANYLPTDRVFMPGLLVLGDALSMRHPVTGSGMTVCLEDIKLWVDLMSEIPNLYDYEGMKEATRIFYGQRKPHIFTISCLAEIWNGVFSSSDAYLKQLKLGMINYLKLGGKCAEEPVLMFAGYTTAPLSLLKHLTTALLFTCYQTLISQPLVKLPLSFVNAAGIFAKAMGLTLKFTIQEFWV